MGFKKASLGLFSSPPERGDPIPSIIKQDKCLIFARDYLSYARSNRQCPYAKYAVLKLGQYMLGQYNYGVIRSLEHSLCSFLARF